MPVYPLSTSELPLFLHFPQVLQVHCSPDTMVALTSSQREAILNGPAGYPPAGKTANLTDPPNMHTIGRIVHLILFIVASLCFIIRIYTKACVVRHVRMSDCEH